MMALTLMDHALRHRAQNADVRCATPRVPAQAPAEVVARLQRAAAIENPDPDEA
jgi:chorismate synthase